MYKRLVVTLKSIIQFKFPSSLSSEPFKTCFKASLHSNSFNSTFNFICLNFTHYLTN